jgi:ascorbate-specific PTS system EIIC-type component UlaA
LSGWAVIFALGATVVIFGNAANWFDLPNWLYFLQDSQTQSVVVVILVFAMIIWFITKEDKEKKPGEYSGIEDLGRILGYKKG